MGCNIRVERYEMAETYTMGMMYINGQYFCDTLEDTYRDLKVEAKVKGETAIPEGFYSCKISRSKRFQRDLPEVQNVPYFIGIRIHAGNTVAHTEGCILVGHRSGQGTLAYGSRNYENKLVEKLRGETNITVHVTNAKVVNYL